MSPPSPTSPIPSSSRLRRWMGTILRRNLGRDGDSHFKQLPMELVIEIALIATSNSQKMYKTFLLVSRGFRTLMERECLPRLPIRLEATSSILSFHKMLVARPDLAGSIRHLWIRGARSRYRTKEGFSEPTASTWRQFKASAFEQLHIIHTCTNLISLACSFPVMLISSRVAMQTFGEHHNLKELTLLENWDLWSCVDESHLFLRLTHLLILDSVTPQFSTDLFPALKHFSARAVASESRPTSLDAAGADSSDFSLPSCLQSFSEDVKITLHMENSVEMGLSPVAGGRGLMKIGELNYFKWWCERTTGGQGAWCS